MAAAWVGATFFIWATATVASAQTCPTPTFGSGVPAPLGEDGSFVEVAAADFNGDQAADYAAVRHDGVDILLATGDGRLTLAGRLDVLDPWGIDVADFNGDGRLDLAILPVNYSNGTVEVFRGVGDGTFTPLSTLVSTALIWKIVAGDFTNDGVADIVGIVHTPEASAALFAGDGSGGFASPTNFPIGSAVADVVSGDFNGDLRPDLAAAVVTSAVERSIRLLFGMEAGGFTGPTIIPIDGLATELVAGDFDGTGALDLITVDPIQGVASLLAGDGTGGFTDAGVVARIRNEAPIIAADFDGDGVTDLAIGNRRLETFPGGLTSFTGMLDLLRGGGPGGFTIAESFVIGDEVGHLAAGDGNADGQLDVLAITWAPATQNAYGAAILLNTCGAAIDATVTMALSANPVFPNHPLTLTLDVANSGPDAAPVIARMMVGVPIFVDDVSTTRGACRPVSGGRLANGMLTCWFGDVPAGQGARVTIRVRPQALGDYPATVRVAAGGLDPNLTNNADGEVVRVAVLGGENFLLAKAPGGPVRLSWEPGAFQAGYYIGRFVNGAMTVLPATGIPLPADATSFVDAAPVTGADNCYVVTPVNSSGVPLGRSDMLCVKPDSASGQAPPDFSISLGDTLAYLAWEPPGGQTGYLLALNSFDGGSPAQRTFSDGNLDFVHHTDGVPFCYVIIPGNGTTPLGASDQFCAVPGVEDLVPPP
jgi:hypothetical protein